jgi:tetratricopeptide (TPR) repeat protein
MALKSAEHLRQDKRWTEAAAFHQRSLQLAPDEAQYWSMAADGLHEQAESAGDVATREEAITEALMYAREAALREPMHPGHLANVGRLYLWWATVTGDPDLKRLRGQSADAYLTRALALMPTHPREWTERATVHAEILGNDASALAYARRAAEIDPLFAPAHQLLGDLYGRRVGREANEDARAQYVRAAVDHYEEALRLAPAQVVNPYEVHLNASKLHARLGQKGRALEHAAAALRLAPDAERENVGALVRAIEDRPDGAR